MAQPPTALQKQIHMQPITTGGKSEHAPSTTDYSSQRSLLVLTSLLGKAADTEAHGSAKSTRVPCSQPLCADTHITSPPELLQLQVSFSTRAHLTASLQLQGQQHPSTHMGDQMGCMVSRTRLWLQVFGPPLRKILHSQDRQRDLRQELPSVLLGAGDLKLCHGEL